MAWIEVHQSLFTHRKTLALADRFDMPEVHIAGHLIALWTWALDNAPEGILPESHRIIARASQWEGDATVWVNALIADGFLEDALPAGFAIHDWHEYAGKLIDRRKRNAEAMRVARAAHQPSIKGARVAHVDNTSTPHADTCKATVPNRTVPNRTVPDQSTESAPQADAPRPRSVPKPAKGSRIPPNFTITPEMRAWASEKVPGLDIEWHTEEFIDFWQSAKRDGEKLDWPAVWRNRMRDVFKAMPRGAPRSLAIANGRASPEPPRVLTAYERRVQERGAAK